MSESKGHLLKGAAIKVLFFFFVLVFAITRLLLTKPSMIFPLRNVAESAEWSALTSNESLLCFNSL